NPKRLQKIERSAEKRAIATVRYVLPVAAFTTIVHTTSGIVLHRLWRMSAASDTPSEARAVIGEMVAHVKEIDAQFFDRFGTEPLEELPEWKNTQLNVNAGEGFAREFDAQLNGKTSRLVDYSPNAVRVMAESYRAVAGLTAAQCDNAEAIDRLLNPARNLYRLETLNVGVHAPIMRALQHANYTFAKSIRLYESGSLLHLIHKWTMRTCFNAQEEIYQSSMDEIAQLREVHPELSRYIGPPCHIRAGITTPICTEGSHFCGIKVWLD